MAPTDDKLTKQSWGQQLAQLCCGELLGKYGGQPRAEYVESAHGMRFHGGEGDHPIDFPLDDSPPDSLAGHARDLVNRYIRHKEHGPNKPTDPPRTP